MPTLNVRPHQAAPRRIVVTALTVALLLITSGRAAAQVATPVQATIDFNAVPVPPFSVTFYNGHVEDGYDVSTAGSPSQIKISSIDFGQVPIAGHFLSFNEAYKFATLTVTRLDGSSFQYLSHDHRRDNSFGTEAHVLVEGYLGGAGGTLVGADDAEVPDGSTDGKTFYANNLAGKSVDTLVITLFGCGTPFCVGGVEFDNLVLEGAPLCDGNAWTVRNEAGLKAAIDCFNAKTTPGTYTITLAQDIALTASTPAITNGRDAGYDLVIDGGGFAVDGQGISGVKPFWVYGGPGGPGELTLNDLTIKGGRSTGDGGGIDNYGVLTLNNSTVTGNSAANGGGICNRLVLTLNNSTVSGNSATNEGGGIYNGNASDLRLNSTTFSGNSAADGGAIFNANARIVEIKNSILANSTSGGDCRGTATSPSGDHTLIEDSGQTCGLTDGANGNIVGLDPVLDVLADNGGPTPTHALLPGSPAINAGDTTLTIDQRGIARPQDGVDDIGAFELGNPIKVTALLTVTTSGQRTDTTAVSSEGPAGVFSFTARYCNKSTSTSTLTSLFTRTRELTNGNSLVNRDRDGTGTPPGGVGSELDFPLTPAYDDGQLAPGECVNVPYQIGLTSRARFTFNVDPYGYSVP